MSFTVGQSAFLGLVQGLTEFLPVSSSAHLKLTPWFLKPYGWSAPPNEQAFDVALHIGTTLALLAFFFFDWLQIVAHYIGDFRQGNWKGGKKGSMLWKIAVACVPGAIVGKLFEHKIDNFFYHDERNIWWLAVTMAAFGAGLALAEKMGKKHRGLETITYADALMIGCAQAIALIPGTSRSGITILAGLVLGLSRPAAARFSFLVALPITLGAVVLKSKDLRGVEDWTPLLVGILTAAISGVIAIKGLLHFVATRPYYVFAYYRWVLAIPIVWVYIGRGAPAHAAPVAAPGAAPTVEAQRMEQPKASTPGELITSASKLAREAPASGAADGATTATAR